MKDSPNIAHIAHLIGDPARANILTALMDGRALTASELASHAGVTRQTTSVHLAKLVDGSLLARESQGRHRYFRLAGTDVAAALEALMGLAGKPDGSRTRTGPKDPALRKARACYRHLAGALGVHMHDRMHELGWLRHSAALTRQGGDALLAAGLDVNALGSRRREMCRPCLDWSQRRHHLAGSLGDALLSHILSKGWARRLPETRIISFSRPGEKAFRDWLS